MSLVSFHPRQRMISGGDQGAITMSTLHVMWMIWLLYRRIPKKSLISSRTPIISEVERSWTNCISPWRKFWKGSRWYPVHVSKQIYWQNDWIIPTSLWDKAQDYLQFTIGKGQPSWAWFSWTWYWRNQSVSINDWCCAIDCLTQLTWYCNSCDDALKFLCCS